MNLLDFHRQPVCQRIRPDWDLPTVPIRLSTRYPRDAAAHDGVEYASTLRDAIAFSAVLCLATAVISGIIFGGNYYLTELARYSVTDMLRMVCVLP